MSDIKITDPVRNARAAWGSRMPDWVEAMAVECAATSQSKVAAKMGRSASLVSQILNARYPGDLTGVEEVFRGAFQNHRVECPAIGTMPSNECQDWRRKSKTFASGNPLRVRMFRACANCPKNLPMKEELK